jgi:hypothetical protein
VRRILASVVVSLAACGFQVTALDGIDAPSESSPEGGASPDDGAATTPDAGVDAPADAANPGPAIVQQVTASAPNTNAPLSATLSSPPVSGHLLIMIGAAEHGGLSTVTGGGVATWTRATSSLTNSNVELWYGVTAGSSATVTITFPAYTLPIWMAVSEWSGMASTNVLDGARSTAGGASPAGAGTLATTHAHDLLVFAVADNTPNTFGAPTSGPWATMTGVTATPIVQAAWYREVLAMGSYGPTVTETAHSWDAAAAAFRVAP